MDDITVMIINNVVEVIFAIMGTAFTVVVIPWIAKTAIPWMKEKHIYSLVQKFVRAAEKKAEAGSLAKSLKKDYVINLLEAKGITVTDDVDAFIEAAVKELDVAINSTVLEVAGVIDENSNND